VNADVMMSLAGLSLAIWLVLEFFRGGFWRADQRLSESEPRSYWPSVVAIIPARDEAPTIGRTVASLMRQNYAGPIHVIVVDDSSDDGTAAAAGDWPNLRIVPGSLLPGGWTGKLWAVHQGLTHVNVYFPDVEYILMTDGDIIHGPNNITQLVNKAESEQRHLVSLMVKLRAQSFWEKLLIPAFVFFFQKLYPFPWVNDPASPTAAAAGGCMLIRRETLQRAGGVEPIRDQLIDDCAMGRLIKAHGAIWLGLTDETRSLRAYDTLDDIWSMVARTAFVQLDYSLLSLIGTVAGMVVIYLVPPAAVFYGLAHGHYNIAIIGGVSWAVMAASYWPTLKLYDGPMWRAAWLPAAALLYTMMTISSALRHWQGKGGGWKGRHYGG